MVLDWLTVSVNCNILAPKHCFAGPRSRDPWLGESGEHNLYLQSRHDSRSPAIVVGLFMFNMLND
jgi:hypothetical protein